MAKKTTEGAYKVKWVDGSIYELETFGKQSSVDGKEFTVSLGTRRVTLEGSQDRLKGLEDAVEEQKAVVKAIKDAKPKAVKKGPK